MARIEKLMICGIRSYSPAEPSVIEFQTPLTLIVGPNGTGKTSIIESLKYITSGEMPPGCNKNMSAFVHDPKIAGEREVKGHVKLKFKDVTGTTYHCTRTMVSTQKSEAKTDTKSIEGVISKVVNGQKVSISTRCLDFTKEMVVRLGVSKAILDNVIFCHQEDAYWPLSEGKVLKKKFDDIFASTRYIKALESMRSLRKEQGQLVKEYAIELHHLKQNKEKSEEIADDLSKCTTKMEATKDSIKKLDDEIEPLVQKLTELNAVSEEIVELEKKISNFKSVRKELLSNKAQLQEKMDNVFEGSTEELETMLKDFKDKVLSKERNLLQLETQLQNCNKECQRLTTEKSQLLQLRGKFEQEAAVHERTIVERDELIVELGHQQDVSGFSNAPFNTEQVTDFMNQWRIKFKNTVEIAAEEKRAKMAEITKQESQIDAVKKNFNEQEMSIKHKKNRLTVNESKLSQIDGQLRHLNASAGRLQSLDAEIKHCESDIADSKSGFDAASMNMEIDQMMKEKSSLNLELSQLREEQNQMHLMSQAQTKIEMLRKDKHEKEDSISRILNDSNAALTSMFGSRPPVDTIRSRVTEYLKSKRSIAQKTSSDLKSENYKMTSIQAKQKLYQDQLKEKEQNASRLRLQMSEACGENDFNSTLDQLRHAVDKQKDVVMELEAFERILVKYVEAMTESDRQDANCCPLCHRQFEKVEESKKLISELRKKIVALPERQKENRLTLEEEKKKMVEIERLSPVKTNLDRLENEDIPDLRSKCSKLSEELKTVNDQVDELALISSTLDREEKLAQDIEADVRLLDNYKYELKTLDRSIHLESAKLQGIAPGRTMQAITSAIREKQENFDTLSRKLEQRRTHMMESERQLSILERNLNDLQSQKLQLAAQLQTRSQLEEQKAELGADNEACKREIRECEDQLEPIKHHLDQEVNKKITMAEKLEKHNDEVRRTLERVKASGTKLRDKHNEIMRYINDEKPLQHKENEGKLDIIKNRNVELENRKTELSMSIQEASDDVAQQKVKERELHDNLTLHSIEKRLRDVSQQINNADKRLDSFGAFKNHAQERFVLQNRLEGLRKDRDMHEGRVSGYRDSIKRFQRELRSELYAKADEKHRNKLIQVKTTELANTDLEKYYKALDRAIMRFHGLKMNEINQIIKDYWMKTYSGHDIDTIEIRADEDDESGAAKTRRTYKYRVVMIKRGTPMDMRSRCSAGQKVLASIIIRLALAETFCLNCGILALDEPTTNLDEQNIESLANSLKEVITARQQQRNFQLIIITHDEEFVQALGRSDYVDYYFRVYKDEGGHSKIHRQSTAEIEEGH